MVQFHHSEPSHHCKVKRKFRKVHNADIRLENNMIKLHIPDMSCGHCTGVVTKTVKGLDPNAILEFNMEGHIASIESSQPEAALQAALEAAGYPATVAG
jgi:copper chaperone